MPNRSIDDVKRAELEAKRREESRNTYYGRRGKQVGSGWIVEVPNKPRFIYVTLDGGGTIIEAWNGGQFAVAPTGGKSVTVKRFRDGRGSRFETWGRNPQELNEDDEVLPHAPTHRRDGSDPIMVELEQIDDYSGVPTTGLSLTIHGGFYSIVNDVAVAIPTDTVTVSATGLSSGEHRWEVIVIDTLANAFEIVSGPELPTSTPLTDANLAEIEFEDWQLPRLAIPITYGQMELDETEFRSMRDTVIGFRSNATGAEIDPDEGQELKCVVATRITGFVEELIAAAGVNLTSGVLAVATGLTTYFSTVVTSPSPTLILELANLLVANYADDTELEADFTSGLFLNMKCYVYCAKGGANTVFLPSDLDTLQDFLSMESGTEWDVLALLFQILGPAGMTTVLSTSVLTASAEDCSSDCSCSYSFEFTSAASPTLEGCTAVLPVVLHMGEGVTGHDIDVAISVTGGTATSGDYTLHTATVTFPAGSSDGDTQEVEIEITSGDGADDNETIILKITPDEGEIGSHEFHTLTILAGGCAKAWTQDFIFSDVNGLQGWTIIEGSLTASGIVTGSTFLFTGSAEIEFSIPHSSVMTTLQFDTTLAFGGGTQNLTMYVDSVLKGCNPYTNAPVGPPCQFPTGTSLLGVADLSLTSQTIHVLFSFFTTGAANQFYLRQVRMAGTGINPFTMT